MSQHARSNNNVNHDLSDRANDKITSINTRVKQGSRKPNFNIQDLMNKNCNIDVNTSHKLGIGSKRRIKINILMGNH